MGYRRLSLFACLGLVACMPDSVVQTSAGIAAKTLCSGVHVMKRQPAEVWQNDVIPIGGALVVYDFTEELSYSTDPSARSVSVQFSDYPARVAAYREGLGCVLYPPRQPPPSNPLSCAVPETSDGVTAETSVAASSARPLHELWPRGERVEPLANLKLRQAIANAFLNPLAATRAVIVVHRGQIVGEQYAEGFSKDTPFLGWSMGKSITNLLVGIRASQRNEKGEPYLRLDQNHLLTWTDNADLHSRITLEQLLRMRPSLEFNEGYFPGSDVTQMLYEEADFAAFAAGFPLDGEPGTTFNYSSGTTNIAMKVLRETFSDYQSYCQFPQKALFEPIGAHSALFEADPSGTFVGSSYPYATARDWARLGLLYLQNGRWFDQQIVPQDWMIQSTTMTNDDIGPPYGFFVWGGRDPLPEDAYAFSGHWGQSVLVVPSMELVIVRLGWTIDWEAWDRQVFTQQVMEAVAD